MQRAIAQMPVTLSDSNKTFDNKYWRDSVENAAEIKRDFKMEWNRKQELKLIFFDLHKQV